MYCNRCGNEINKDSKFCPYCGKKVLKDDNKVKILKKLKRSILYIIPLLPLVVFLIIFCKVNSIKGHWYYYEARKGSSVIEYNSYSLIKEINFNSNGTFSLDNRKSIDGTYTAKNKVLSLCWRNYTDIYSYEIKLGKLYIYKGEKTFVYARRIIEIEPESIQVAEINCTDDDERFAIYNTDLVGKTFITNNDAKNNEKYEISIQLKNEKLKQMEYFINNHSGHDLQSGIVVSSERYLDCCSFDSANAILGDSVIIAYYENELVAREKYDDIE